MLLKHLQSYVNQENMGAIKTVEEEISVLLEQEYLKWRQRAKANWYSLGEKNTVFSCLCYSKKEEE